MINSFFPAFQVPADQKLLKHPALLNAEERLRYRFKAKQVVDEYPLMQQNLEIKLSGMVPNMADWINNVPKIIEAPNTFERRREIKNLEIKLSGMVPNMADWINNVRYFKKMSWDREEYDESRCQKNALILGTMEEFQSSSSNPPTKPSSQNGREHIN
ncbi:hypothetical protein GBA52_024223 [Prunus armeniaca]|nr:hypothetical protein GBA52_024223 [Prunus armeniaca]